MDERFTEILRQAIALHQAGQLADAGRLYLAILDVFPDHADVHHNLGILAMQIQRSDEAVYHFQRALASDPHQGKFWLSFIQALISQGRYVEARHILQQGRLQAGLQGPGVDDLIRQLAQPNAEAISHLLDLLKQGRYADAESEANRFIGRFPEHGVSWKVLGLCLRQRGRISEALESMKKSVELSPDDEAAYYEYASTLHAQGRLEEAAACYRQVLRINPGNAQSLHCLGILSFNLGKYQEAEDWFTKCLALAPVSVDGLLYLGLTRRAQGRLKDAEHAMRRALLYGADDPRLYLELSIVLKMQGLLSEAEVSCQRALAIDSNYGEAYGNLGVIRFDQGYIADAELCFSKALSIKPDFVEFWNNLGTCQQLQRKLLEAESAYRKAIALNQNYAEAHTNLGINLQSQGRIPEAESCWRQSLTIKPDQPATQSGLVFHLTYSASCPGSDYLSEAKIFGQMVVNRVNKPFGDWHCDQQPERLRVGLVSGDLRNHPVGQFLYGLVSQAGTIHIDFIAYATQPGTDEFSTSLRPFFVDWKNIGGLSDEVAAKMIRDDGIHILIDLAGHSSHNRLSVFAWKPAPVQVSWLGYLASTGLNAIDYILTDQYSIRREDEGYFMERIWRMPGSCICFTPPVPSVGINRLPAMERGAVTFGSFNNLAKMGDSVVALWCRVLHSVPNSRLYLKASQLNEPLIQERTRQRFAAFGIDGERLIIAETKADHAAHLRMYHNIDIALDTFPYPGVTTTVEALWMGVPVLTLRGDGILARAGESIAINAGLPDWIADDENDFVDKAVRFSRNWQVLYEIRNTLRPRLLASPLFDCSSFAKSFDEALWAMWHEYLYKN